MPVWQIVLGVASLLVLATAITVRLFVRGLAQWCDL